MADAGPSCSKKPKNSKNRYYYRRPLTEKELEQCLLDSDNDIQDNHSHSDLSESSSESETMKIQMRVQNI
ncbi:hypothetical protein QE152_g26190 [Popillia japonica]|uniref:Uncharacterized protein n=1 Tax=Popillia japonica TaxID=7064 RepID=A0AAW1JXM4_POPJA